MSDETAESRSDQGGDPVESEDVRSSGKPTSPRAGRTANFSGLIDVPYYGSLAASMVPDLRVRLFGTVPSHPSINIAAAAAGLVPPLIPRRDFASITGIDLGRLAGAGTENLAAQLLGLDINQLFPQFDFKGIGQQLAAQWKAAQPPNWPEGWVDDLELIEQIVNDEGIPLVWVPREEVVKALFAAESRSERVALLLGRRDDLVVDCQAVLSEVTHSRLDGQLPLAGNAVDTFLSGHEQAAQALAVVVTESAIKQAIVGRYHEVKTEVRLDVDEVPFSQFRAQAALAPIGSFFTPWWADGDEPPPSQLSRHVSVHHAHWEHYTSENALLSLLLMTSVLRALSDTWHLQDPEDSKNPAHHRAPLLAEQPLTEVSRRRPTCDR